MTIPDGLLLADDAPALFQPYEEHGIISLLIDFPEQFSTVAEYLTPDLFHTVEAKYIIAILQSDYSKNQLLPSRRLLADRAAKMLTAEDPHEEILGLIKRPSDPRDVPFLRDTLRTWTERQIYSTLYQDEAMDAHARGDFSVIKGIVDKAERLRATETSGFWLFEQLDELFVDRAVDHLTTGFKSLDKELNNGGPARCETVVWMGPTGVGKSIVLCNNAFTCVREGLNVLYVTFELSATMTAMRIMGAMTNLALDSFMINNINDMTESEIKVVRETQESAKHKALQFANKGTLAIYDLPPGECTVDDVRAIIDVNKKTRSWTPDVVILDYLELMSSRERARSDDEYMGQKRVSTEVRGLAKKENVLVFTATQSNRSSLRDREANIDLDKSAESYFKKMPADYVISINQTEEEYNPPDGGPSTMRFWIAKNRNGRKFVSVTANVWYDRMLITEAL